MMISSSAKGAYHRDTSISDSKITETPTVSAALPLISHRQCGSTSDLCPPLFVLDLRFQLFNLSAFQILAFSEAAL
jgi:hypothetical protein